MPSPETRCHSGPGMPFINGGGGSASPHADPGGGDAAYYRAVTVSSPDINTPRVSELYILNVFELRFGLGPVKSLHILISLNVFWLQNQTYVLCLYSTVSFPSEVAVSVAGRGSSALLQYGWNPRRLLLPPRVLGAP